MDSVTEFGEPARNHYPLVDLFRTKGHGIKDRATHDPPLYFRKAPLTLTKTMSLVSVCMLHVLCSVFC